MELSPGAMALNGLPEPQVLMTLPLTIQAEHARTFATNFDRSMVITPPSFGEGRPWLTSAAVLPLIQFISGPVYLLKGPQPAVTTQYTDYELMHAQVTAFIQMILDLNRACSGARRG
jgi:hypothetical protein